MKQISFSRKELYDLVWSMPVYKLAKQYNISDNGIRKKCIKLDIPLPERGYWQKLKFEHKVSKSILSIEKFSYNVVAIFFPENSSVKEKSQSMQTIHKNQIRNDPKVNLVVPEKLYSPHYLVIKSRDALMEHMVESFDRKGIVYGEGSPINIEVSQMYISRALRFVNAFVRLLYSRNHGVVEELYNITIDNNSKRTENYIWVAEVFGETFKFGVREKLKVVMNEDEYPRREFHASGTLLFWIKQGWNKKEWGNGKNEIEKQLLNIIYYIESKAAKEKMHKLNSKIMHWHADKERKIMEAKVKLQNDEFSRFMNLVQQANHWKICHTLTEYVSVVENSNVDFEDKQEWLQWAKQKESWFNPHVNAKDKLLDDSYRQKALEKLSGKKGDNDWEPKGQEFNYFQYLNAPYYYWK